MKVTEVDQTPNPDATSGFDMKSGGIWSRPGFLIRRLHQIHCAIFFEEFNEGDITPVQYGILTVLTQKPWLDQTTIGFEVGLDRTTSADVIKRLEDKGLVKRRINQHDRRSRQAAVTEKGLAMMDSLYDKMVQSQLRMLQPLSQEEQQTFMKLLVKLAQANNHYGRAALKAF